jgi:hypothetical protein
MLARSDGHKARSRRASTEATLPSEQSLIIHFFGLAKIFPSKQGLHWQSILFFPANGLTAGSHQTL